MNRARIVLLLAIILFVVGACAFGVYELLSPPFTDQDIQSSLVDTWEVSAWTTMALLVVLALAVALSLAMAYRTTRPVRRLSAVAVFGALLAGVLALSNHASLTNRATQLTRQTFGTFYGLL